jgi:hypothetical protein
MQYIKTFEIFKSKEERSEFYRTKALESPIEDRIIEISELEKHNIPPQIIEEMSGWDSIIISPHGKSFYDSKSNYRVSDHWNYIAREKLRCKTNSPVKNLTHITLCKYDKENKIYNVLISLPSPEFNKKQEFGIRKKEFMKNPELIAIKREFKERVNNREILVEIEVGGKKYKGILRKYTGSEIKIENESGELIFGDNFLDNNRYLIKL